MSEPQKTFEQKMVGLVNEAATNAGLSLTIQSRGPKLIDVIIKENTHIKDPIQTLKDCIKGVCDSLGTDEKVNFQQFHIKATYHNDPLQEFSVLSCFMRVVSPS